MARNDDLACLICMSAPCACNKPQGATPRRAGPRKAATPKPAPESIQEEAAPPARPSFMDKIRQQAAAEEAGKKSKELQDKLIRTPVKSQSRFAERMTDEEAALLAAVRLLSEAFEIHPDDLQPFKDRLSREPSVEERAGAWRYRNGGQGST